MCIGEKAAREGVLEAAEHSRFDKYEALEAESEKKNNAALKTEDEV